MKEKMEYSLDFTKKYPLSKRSLESLNTIIKKEGGMGVFKVTTLAINLDNIERELHKNQAKNTISRIFNNRIKEFEVLTEKELARLLNTSI